MIKFLVLQYLYHNKIAELFKYAGIKVQKEVVFMVYFNTMLRVS